MEAKGERAGVDHMIFKIPVDRPGSEKKPESLNEDHDGHDYSRSGRGGCSKAPEVESVGEVVYHSHYICGHGRKGEAEDEGGQRGEGHLGELVFRPPALSFRLPHLQLPSPLETAKAAPSFFSALKT